MKPEYRNYLSFLQAPLDWDDWALHHHLSKMGRGTNLFRSGTTNPICRRGNSSLEGGHGCKNHQTVLPLNPKQYGWLAFRQWDHRTSILFLGDRIDNQIANLFWPYDGNLDSILVTARPIIKCLAAFLVEVIPFRLILLSQLTSSDSVTGLPSRRS